jgi:hypothetical protein
MLGETPLKVMGPPAMIVTVAITKRVLSALAVATTVTFAGVVLVEVDGVTTVGTVAGAV